MQRAQSARSGAPRRLGPCHPRAELQPQHNFLFSRCNGLPMTDKALYDMFGEAHGFAWHNVSSRPCAPRGTLRCV